MQSVALYITGATGDNAPKVPEAGFAETRRVGEVLATAAITRSFDALRITEPVRLKTLTRTVAIRQRTHAEFMQDRKSVV